jgi:hypothetical protein
MNVKVTTSIRLDPDIKKSAEQKAASENRSLSNMIETLLKKDLGK